MTDTQERVRHLVLNALDKNHTDEDGAPFLELTLKVRAEGLSFDEARGDSVATFAIIPTNALNVERIEVPLRKVVSLEEAPQDISSFDPKGGFDL